MQTGKLKDRVSFQSRSSAQDGAGQPVETWTEVVEMWAQVADITGKEFIAAGGVQNKVTTTIVVRYTTSILASMRAVCGSDTFKIEAVLRKDKKSLLLMCSRLT